MVDDEPARPDAAPGPTSTAAGAAGQQTQDAAQALDEVTLVARAQDGDPAAFEQLVDAYQERLFRHVYRMVREQNAAEDVVQDSFVAAWQRLPSLLQPAAFRGWLYQISTRRTLDLIRARREHLPLDEQVETAGSTLGSRTGQDPAAVHEQQAQLESLQHVLAGLPVLQRAIWSMREIDGLSYEEIARATNLPVSTVRGRIARTRRHLAERMSPWR